MTESSLVVLTGAGISADSGLGTFRSRDGIWAKYDLHKVATPGAFASDPKIVHEFYNLRRKACLAAAVLNKSAEGRASPIPRRTYPTDFVTGIPSAV